MIKVVLISLYGVENIGIRLISSVLKKEHLQVTTIYLKKWVNNNILPPRKVEVQHLLNFIKNINPSLIGISLGSPYFKIAKDLTRQIKEKLDALIVWGGIHATIVPEECIEIADIVCIGEGEYPMLELVKNISEGKKIDNIQNLWIRQEDKVRKNALRDLIQDLDKLPLPDLEDENKYYIEDNRIFQEDPLYKSAEYRIIASRGCPFSCIFCVESCITYGPYWRPRSIDLVLEEIEAVIDRYSPKQLWFDDSVFTVDKKRIIKLCKAMNERGIDIPWGCMTGVTIVDEKLLKV